MRLQEGERFVQWQGRSDTKMTRSQPNSRKRKEVQRQDRESSDEEAAPPVPMPRMRAEGERRQKARQDGGLGAASRGQPPAPKRKKPVEVEPSDDDDSGPQGSQSEEAMREQSWRYECSHRGMECAPFICSVLVILLFFWTSHETQPCCM